MSSLRQEFVPEHPCGTGVLCLRGSSGHLDSERAALLARHGAFAVTIRWFGGEGQPAQPTEIPVEWFADELNSLAAQWDRVVMVGTSFGAEAALVTGSLYRVDAVAAFSPSSVVWAGVRADGTQTSHWSYGGRPLPFVPFVEDWMPPGGPPAYRTLYEQSLASLQGDDPARLEAATIAVERVPELLLVAGGDDQVWPSTEFASQIVARRSARGLPTSCVTSDSAGHLAPLPGMAAPAAGMAMARGGSVEADEQLGALAWSALVDLLRLQNGGSSGH